WRRGDMTVSKRMKWVLLIMAGVVVVAAGGIFYLWHSGWIVKSPAAVLKDTLARANQGKYDEAAENLIEEDRLLFTKEPKLLKAVLDLITRKGNIKSVDIAEETFGNDDATVRFEIAYSDGDSLTSSERFKKEGGGWKHSLANTHLKLAE